MPMHPLFAALLPLFAAFPVVAGQDGSQQTSQTDVIALGRDDADRMTVPVRMGDRGPFEFLIDTGSQNTVLSTDLASRLALKPGRKVKLTGVAGSSMVDAVELDQIDLGRRSYYSLLAPLLDNHDIGADGILGLDSLQGQRLLIDFEKKLIAVSDAKSLGGNRGFEIVVTARRRSGQLIMTDAMLDGVKVDVVIDTGAESSIGNRALQRAMRRQHSTSQVTLHSVTGQQIIADIGLGKELEIDKINFTNVLIAFADAPAFAALDLDKRPALLLGMRDLRGLKRIAVDFSTRKIYFDMPKGAL